MDWVLAVNVCGVAGWACGSCVWLGFSRRGGVVGGVLRVFHECCREIGEKSVGTVKRDSIRYGSRQKQSRWRRMIPTCEWKKKGRRREKKRRAAKFKIKKKWQNRKTKQKSLTEQPRIGHAASFLSDLEWLVIIIIIMIISEILRRPWKVYEGVGTAL